MGGFGGSKRFNLRDFNVSLGNDCAAYDGCYERRIVHNGSGIIVGGYSP